MRKLESRITNLELRMNHKLLISFFMILYSLFLLFYSSPASAQTACGTGLNTLPRADSLVSAGSFSSTSKFFISSGGACIEDSKTAFAIFKVPTYEDLLNTYYSKAVNTGNIAKFAENSAASVSFTNVNVDSATANYLLYNFSNPTGVVTTSSLSGSITNPKTTIVFVNGRLDITSNIVYNGNDGGGATGNNIGLVFVVKGDVFIRSSATLNQVNAIIISYGTICTGATNTLSCPDSSTALPPLNIYGSLVSMDKGKPIKFNRFTSDPANSPGEFITAQAKYFYVLKNIFSENLIITSQENTFPTIP